MGFGLYFKSAGNSIISWAFRWFFCRSKAARIYSIPNLNVLKINKVYFDPFQCPNFYINFQKENFSFEKNSFAEFFKLWISRDYSGLGNCTTIWSRRKIKLRLFPNHSSFHIKAFGLSSKAKPSIDKNKVDFLQMRNQFEKYWK